MSLTSGFIREALSGKAKVISKQFGASKPVSRVWTDSRSLQSKDLFVALKGDVFDGHEFIADAVGQRGVTSIVCEKYPANTTQDGVDIFLVEDSLKAYRSIAKAWKLKLAPKTIAIAGSVGKTTTKDLLWSIAKEKFPHTQKTQGSQNGYVGIPMTFFELRSECDVAVIEVGIDRPGAMADHIELVEPDISIVTAISEEHLEWLIDLPTVAREENLILRETSQADGVSIVNLDDPWIAPVFEEVKLKNAIGFSLVKPASSNIVNGRLNQSVLTVEGGWFSSFQVKCPLPGEHNARNLLGAISAAMCLGLKPQEIVLGLEEFVPSVGRSVWSGSANGSRVFCDYYNANPSSMKAAFQVIRESVSNSSDQVWLCLGDMKELGSNEQKLHESLATDIANSFNRATCILVGERMKWLANELTKISYQGSVEWFEDSEEAAIGLSSRLQGSQNVVLVKGSRSLKMEKIWQSIA